MMYQCFHCLTDSVIWDNDFSAEDYGIDDKDGIVQVLHCTNCGAQIQYYIPGNTNDEDKQISILSELKSEE